MKNVHIIGASRGIGLELVKQHADAGDRVYAYARNPSESDELTALANGNDSISAHEMDMAEDASVASGAADSGSDPVDLLWIVGGVSGKIEPMLDPGDWESFDNSIEINMKGPLRVLRAFLPRLREGSKAISFSSQLAASTWPYGGFYPYVASKSGMAGIMRAAALDLKDKGIIVGVVHPGWVQTDMGGEQADITPEQSATGLRKVAEKWTINETGAFYNWDGNKHAW